MSLPPSGHPRLHVLQLGFLAQCVFAGKTKYIRVVHLTAGPIICEPICIVQVSSRVHPLETALRPHQQIIYRYYAALSQSLEKFRLMHGGKNVKQAATQLDFPMLHSHLIQANLYSHMGVRISAQRGSTNLESGLGYAWQNSLWMRQTTSLELLHFWIACHRIMVPIHR